MTSAVFADIVRPSSPRLARVFDASLVAGFSLLIALGAQVAIPLPFTPVPVTLQTFVVILAGCLLGSVRGGLAALAYLAEGCGGLPFFAGGTAGIARLLGPTGGYLVGMIVAACVAGVLVEGGFARRWFGLLLTLLAADLSLFLPGVIWLSAFTGASKAIALGLTPFVVGDVLKIAVAWGVLHGAAILLPKREA